MKPVAWIKESEIAGMSASAGLGIFEWKTNLGLKPEPGDVPLYTAPREWVGLTNEEIVGFIAFDGASLADFIRCIEAKLKEKNGYGLQVYGPPTDFISPSVVKAISKREWVGLTDEERFLNDARSKEEIEYAKAIETKLKEKNHG
jgi:hypothetical protein